MKKIKKPVQIIFLALFIVLLGGIIFRNQISTFFSSDPGADPIAYWKFDEGVGTTVNDSSSSNIDAPIGHDISGPAPSFVGINTMVSASSGSISVPVPPAYQEGDLLIIFAESANQDIANPDGWTEISSSPQGQGGGGIANAVRIEIYYKFATASESSVSLPDPADHVVGIMAAFRNVDTINPINVSVGSTSAGSVNNMTLPAVTTTIPNTLIVNALALDTDEDDFSNVNSWTNASLTSLTERFDQTHNDGQGGGMSMATGIMATAGNTGSTIADGDYDDQAAFITFALSSVNGWGGYPTWKSETECINGMCLYFDGSEDAVTIGNTDPIDFDSGLSSDFTISKWVRTLSAGVGETGQIFAKGNNTFLQVINEGSDGYADLQASVDLATTDATVTISNGIELQKWQHISLVYADDGDDEIEVYINGVLKGTSTNGSGAPATSDDSDILIGGSVSDFHGYIDEFKIYDYARTASQIKADYTARGSTKGVSARFGGDDMSRKLSSGLVGHWKMDEASGTSLTDFSGNNNTGTFGSGGSAPTWTAGRYGTGLVFDGTDDRVSTNLSVGSTTYSISAWLNYSDNTYGDIIGKQNEIEFYVNGVDSTLGIGHFYTSGVKYWESPTNSLTKNTWHHVIITHNATSSSNSPTMYIDGVAQTLTLAFDNSSGASVVTSNAAFIGSWNGTNNGAALMYKGTMDEVRFYNRTLDPSEVQALYEYAPRPVGYWKMDESSGSTTVDSSGNGNNGTTTGSPIFVKGKFGNAFVTTGTAQYTSIPDNDLLDYQSEITFSFWMNPADATNAHRIFRKGNPYTGGGKGYSLLYRGDQANDPITVQFNDSSSSHTVSVFNLGDVANTWTHVTVICSKSAGSCTGYKNGVLQSSGNHVSGDYAVTDNLEISAPNVGYNGKIDDVKIYNYARTAAQIMEDVNAGHPAPGSPVGSALLHYKFNEGYGTTAYDSSPQKDNGTIIGATWTTNGKHDKALSFDGNDYINAGSELSISNAITISAWINMTAYQTWTSIVDRYGSETLDCFSLGFNSSNGQTLSFAYNATQSGGWANRIISSTVIPLNTWTHVAVSSNGTTGQFYINGKPDGQPQATGAVCNTGDITLGVNFPGSDEYFRGIIDDVKVHSFALTADQIKVEYAGGGAQVMGSGSTGLGGTFPSSSGSREYCVPGDSSTCSAPVGEWKFEEGVGGTANDTSGNGNTGTLTNGPLWQTGKIGKAVFFDGAAGSSQNDVIIAGTGASISNIFDGGGSISFWVKPASTGESNGHFLNKSSNSSGWFLQPQTCDSTRIDFQMRTPTSGTQSQWRADCALNLNQWNHVVVLYNDDAIANDPTFYINGRLVALTLDNNADSAYGSDASNFLGIGNAAAANETIDGLMDEVRMYDYIRTPAQIAWEYNRGAPTAYYKMDECTGTAINDWGTDSNGGYNGNNGTLTLGSGGTTSAGICSTSGAWANGSQGKAAASLSFDGSDDYVFVSDDNFFDFTTDLTLLAWIKSDNLSGGHSFISKWSGDNYSYNFITGGDEITFLYDTTGTASSSCINTTTNANLSTGTWYHAGVTFTSGTIKLYINGKNVNFTSSGTCTSTIDTGDAGIFFGAVEGGTASFFDGQIDEVKIFNYALTPQQIKTEMAGGAVRFQ